MRKVSSYKCPECGMSYKTLSGWGEHMRRIHPGIIPKGWSDARFFYYTLTGRTEGRCIQCHKPTEWNEATGKYSRYCNDPKCKQEYCKVAKQRMIDKYGKPHLLDDPEKQREMLKGKKISGEYKFSDGGKLPYVGSYERDFLMTCDVVLGLSSKDIIAPSPHNYVYMYEGKPHFYIPDFYIPDFNLEIEVKDGGANPNKHHKIQEVDKVKERLKDQVMIGNPAVNYFKVVDKKYDDFFDFILNCKNAIDDDKLQQVQAKITSNRTPAVEGIGVPPLFISRKNAMIEADKFAAEFDSVAGHMFEREIEIAFAKYRDYNSLTHQYAYPYRYTRRSGRFIDATYKNTENLIIEIPLMIVDTKTPYSFENDASFDNKKIIDILKNFERNIHNTIKLRNVYSRYPNVSAPYVQWDGYDWMLKVTFNYQISEANESVNDSAMTSDIEFETPKELYNWMRSNITYSDFTKLMSPEEVLTKKKGSCHDQALFEYTCLKKMGLNPKLLFFITYKEGDPVGDMTHTLCYFEQNGRVWWIENAWDGAKGLRAYSNLNDIKRDILNRYKKTPNFNKYPEMEFASISPEKPGVTLGEYVNAALESIAVESAKSNEPVELEYKGTIKVNDSYGNGKSFTYGNQTAKLYQFNYSWDESVANEDVGYYGLPEDKKYPMDDPKHVLLAIKFFNYVDEDKEKLLASRINERIKEFGIHNINVGEKNRFAKYYEPVEEEVLVNWTPNMPYITVATEGSDPSIHLLDDGFAYAPIKFDKDLYEKYNGTDYYPLYIILMKNISPLGSSIRAFTREDYSHAAISFDATMDDIYTFGNSVIKKPFGRQKTFGAAHESFRKNAFKFSYSEKTEYSLYVMFFKKDEINRIKAKVDEIFLHHEEYKYNVEGLISYVFNKPKTDPKKLFCSQFVALVINSGRNGILNKDPSMYTPVGLSTIRGVCHIETGRICDYAQYRVEKKTHQVFETLIKNKVREALEHANIMYNA